MITKTRASMLLVGLVTCWVCFVLAVPATAAVIWSEPIDGDLPDFPDPWDGNIDPDFVMPEGESTIDGDIVAPETPDDTEDWFKFEIPDDFEIPEARFEFVIEPPVAGSLKIELYFFDVLPSPPAFDWGWEIFWPESEPLMNGKLQDLEPIGGGPKLGTLPAGKYGMRMKTADDPAYSLTFVVRAVPEPTTALLLILAAATMLIGRPRVVR